MSAVRNNSNRSEARKKRSTPYARGFIGTISRFLNYFTGTPTEHSEAIDEDNNRRTNGLQPNGWQSVASSPKSDFSSGNRVPLTPSNAHNGSCSALPEPSTLPVPNAEQVASYFSQRMGANVTTNEVESMITNLQTTPERERFRFTFTTPGRISPPSFSPSNTSPAVPPGSSPSKKLARNPNGVYRWEGGGSAKAPRQRNRFASPAFGASPVKTGHSTTQESAEQSRLPGQDSKRRKFDDIASRSGQPSSLNASTSNGVPFPNMTPSTPKTNGVSRQTSPLPSRLRTPVKPTAPFNPSPLRQAWSDASSTSSHGDSKPSQPNKPTKAANFVAELIKETAPVNKPDLSNPYQTASPVSKVGPPRRGTKRPRAVGRPSLPTKEQKAEEAKKKAEESKKKEEEKLKALSAQAIIEATLPKGSKRSRPPAHIESKRGDAQRSPSPTLRTSAPAGTINYTIEEAEDPERPKKRSRSSSEDSSRPQATLADVTVEEIEDVDMDKEKGKDSAKSANNTSQSRGVQFQSFKPSSIPREPSKLRFSFQAETSSSSSSPLSTPVPLPPPSSEDQSPSISTTVPAPAPPSILAVSSGFNFSFKTPTTPPKDGSESTVRDVDTVKAQVCALDTKALPTFILSPTGSTPSTSTPEHVNAREAAKATHLSSLPSFAFPSTKSFSFGFDPANTKPIAPVNESSSAPKPFPVFNASSNIFANFPSKTSAIPTAASTPVKPFDFAAAGMKLPVVPNNTWICSQCGLSNPQVAVKCTICDEPKLNPTVSTPPAAPPSSGVVASKAEPVKSFDWAAAGLKTPAASNDTWNCGQCLLSNPKSAIKCMVCDADAPGTTSSTTGSAASAKQAVSSTNMFVEQVSKSVTSSSIKAFDFEADGMSRPSVQTGTWVCSLCALSNPDAASACQTCENPK